MTAKTAKPSVKKSKTTKSAKTTTKPKAVATAKITDPVNKPLKKPDEKRSLWLWNVRLAVVLVLLAVAVVWVGSSVSVPLTTQYMAKDVLATEAAGREVLAPAVRHLWDVQVSWLVAKSLVIFAVVYLLAATLLRKRYEAWLDRGVNNLRWIALGLGGGSAMLTVAMLSGVSDISTLSLMLCSVVLAALLAGSAELLGTGRRLRRLLGFGALLGVLLPWSVLMRTGIGAMMFDGSLPTYLYYVYAVVTLLIVGIVLATYLRITQRGRWANTFYAERMFIFLGFLASVVLALQIFSGALQS